MLHCFGLIYLYCLPIKFVHQHTWTAPWGHVVMSCFLHKDTIQPTYAVSGQLTLFRRIINLSSNVIAQAFTFYIFCHTLIYFATEHINDVDNKLIFVHVGCPLVSKVYARDPLKVSAATFNCFFFLYINRATSS